MNNNEPIPSFFAVIPANVLYSKIEPNAKLFYGAISSLTQIHGYCWASNDYLAKLFEVDARTVQRWLESLHKEKFIYITYEKEGLKTDRKIWLSKEIQEMFTERQKCHPPMTNLSPPHDKNVTHINIAYNTKSYSIPQSIKDNSLSKGGMGGPKPKRVEPAPSQSSAEASELATYFFKKLKETNPKFKEPDLKKWASQIEKMLRLDNRSKQEIQAAIDWTQTDPFWKANCLSPENLRKNFDRIYMKIQISKEEDLVRKNRHYALSLKEKYPQELKALSFDKSFVLNKLLGKDLLLSLPHETFKESLVSLFGGRRNAY